jgi:cation diffusion facilitator CzcD-associated flavoprotein CzcO
MTDTPTAAAAADDAGHGVESFDVIVIGAGAQGLCQLYELREAGLSVRCYEAADGVAGTWYWNRYPGCAFDTPSQTYTFSWAEEVLDEWSWQNYYSLREEAEAYLNLVADKFDLRRDIRLGSKVLAATWDEDGHFWEVELETGERARGAYLLPAVGIFGTAFSPPFEGGDRFRGLQLHTARWPREDPDLAGKRVAVIGTGASGVQLVPHLAETCEHVTVFQRTATYCLPQNNAPVTPEEVREWKANYAQIHERLQEVGILVTPDPRNGRDLPKDERLALYEQAWKRRGFDKFMCLFRDLFTDREILTEYSEFLKGKIRERIADPVLADKVVPKNHLFQAKRVPLENGYYEALQRDNVELVDVRETPIECLTENGIRTTDRERRFDVIVYATGFDPVTGAVTSIDIRGAGGRSLKEKWDEHGLSTYLGLTVAGFPNLFITTVPALGASLPPAAEWMSRWFRRCVVTMREQDYTRIEPTRAAEDAWVEHVEETGRQAVFGDAEHSWYVGANVPGKKRRYVLYCKPVPAWRNECFAALENDFEGFDLQRRDGMEPDASEESLAA